MGREQALSNFQRTNSFFKLGNFLQTDFGIIISELRSAALQGRQITLSCFLPCYFELHKAQSYVRGGVCDVISVVLVVDLNLMHCRCDIVVSRPEEE